MSAWLEHVTLTQDRTTLSGLRQIYFSSRTVAGTSLMAPELRFESLQGILWTLSR